MSRRQFSQVEFEPDFKNGCVWTDSGAVVSWDANGDIFVWHDDVLSTSGMENTDKPRAEEHTQRK